MVEHNEYGSDEPRYARAFDLTVPRVCPDCNHHWMSDMETRTRNLALALIRDERTSLSGAEQRKLASWCFLKVLSLEIGRPEEHPPTFPDAMYTGFCRFQHPPLTSCAILIGRRHLEHADGSPAPFIWFNSQGQKHPFPGVGDVGGYRTSLAIGHLVIDVIGLFADIALQLQDADPRLVRIWPVVSPSIRLPAERFMAVEQLGGPPA
jgi:hypothetical protein